MRWKVYSQFSIREALNACPVDRQALHDHDVAMLTVICDYPPGFTSRGLRSRQQPPPCRIGGGVVFSSSPLSSSPSQLRPLKGAPSRFSQPRSPR